MPPVVLLGPQRLRPTLSETLRSLGVTGRIAAITAGWEERELEDDELRRHVEGRAFNLQLWERCERVFERDPALFRAMRARHDRLRALQELYRLRLGHALEAARELVEMDGDAELLDPEREGALEQVRRIDDEHVERVREVHRRFQEEVRPPERDGVALHRRELVDEIAEAEAVAVAGGHVAVLVNRLRLFGLRELLATRVVCAWSAGAMALGERIVLFHDRPPQGRGNAEVMEEGLGLHAGVVPLPHARRRLRLEDTRRMAILARRFAPQLCVPLDEGDRLDFAGAVRPAPGLRVLALDGTTAGFGTP